MGVRLTDWAQDGKMEDTRYSAKEVDNGQNAGTDRDNVRGVGDAERGAHGGRQETASERGIGQDRTGVCGKQISFGSRSTAKQSRLIEILGIPLGNDPAFCCEYTTIRPCRKTDPRRRSAGTSFPPCMTCTQGSRSRRRIRPPSPLPQGFPCRQPPPSSCRPLWSTLTPKAVRDIL